jgi:hypothetical protein
MVTEQKIPARLRQEMESNPDKTFDVILHVTQVDDERVSAIERAGCSVRHKTTIIPCVSVTAPGRTILSLLGESWLVKVEPDQPVHTW